LAIDGEAGKIVCPKLDKQAPCAVIGESTDWKADLSSPETHLVWQILQGDCGTTERGGRERMS
jgi:hypothetical protein